MTTKWYGVEQSSHGHVYRMIFAEDEIRRDAYDGEPVPDDDCIDDGWPLYGSNSSATWITLLHTIEEIRDFLDGEPGCEFEDPMLVDIAEFLYSVDAELGATRYWLDKFGINDAGIFSKEDDAEGHYEESKRMIDALKPIAEMAAGDPDPKWNKLRRIDFKNPWYGDSCEMRFSELQDIYETFCKDN